MFISETVLSCIFAWPTHIVPHEVYLVCLSWMNQSRWRNRLINDSETHKHGHLLPPTGVTMSTLCAYLCNTVELCSWMNQSRWRNRLINDSETHKHGHLSPPTGVTMSTLCAYLCNTVELCSWMNQSRWRNRWLMIQRHTNTVICRHLLV